MGANVSLVPICAWSRTGERALGSALRNWGKNITLLANIMTEGLGPCLAVEGSKTGRSSNYSPDYNSIEETFSKVRGQVRKAGARTREVLIGAMGRALEAVTAQDAREFFR
jgi:hypothetical protein